MIEKLGVPVCSEVKPDLGLVYLFYLHIVRYNIDLNDKKNLDRIFFKNGFYFRKDHDHIKGVETLENIRNMVIKEEISGKVDRDAIVYLQGSPPFIMHPSN
jgi:hypothetical protein